VVPNRNNHHDITEILLKVALNLKYVVKTTIPLAKVFYMKGSKLSGADPGFVVRGT
jgi:hypothetical protein